VSWIKGTDPLALVAIQTGQVNTPSTERGAAGGSRLDTDQRSVEIGEPVPIAFARRRNGKGGVLISPGATECRFENDASNNVTAYYHLVLSEGLIDSIAVKDIFQQSCRVGGFSQTYNRRAGTWTPGNALVVRAGYDFPEASYYCGSIGTYPNMSTLSFINTIPDGFDQWRKQVHAFIRGGMHVTRLVDAVTGPSDNFADLVYWMLSNTKRVPASLIDVPALQTAAEFLEANGFTCNCWITESRNYSDLLADWAPYFLLGESSKNGKKGLRSLLPINANGTINTDPIDWEYIFTEDTIIPGSIEIQYTSFADRLPFVAQMTWRQQLEDDFGIIRTAEVRFAGTAPAGPYESHDMSEYCTSEDHAVKAGAYIVARRRYVTHTIRFSAKPQAHNRILDPGDIMRVKLARTASVAGTTDHDYLYQVERVTKTLAGDVGYEATHLPIDADGCSLVALTVAAATGSGILLTSNKTGVGCDINSYTDNTIPAETFTDIDFVVGAGEYEFAPLDVGVPVDAVIDNGGGTGPTDDATNQDDALDENGVGLYFYSAVWNANILSVKMRISPTGVAPEQALGALIATIGSTSTVAVLPGDVPAPAQPGGMPTVGFTGTIANPWDPLDPDGPVPPSDRVFEGEFLITFAESSFPAIAGDPANQLTYIATVEFTSTTGGFPKVNFLNDLIVRFEPLVAAGNYGVLDIAAAGGPNFVVNNGPVIDTYGSNQGIASTAGPFGGPAVSFLPVGDFLSFVWADLAVGGGEFCVEGFVRIADLANLSFYQIVNLKDLDTFEGVYFALAANAGPVYSISLSYQMGFVFDSISVDIPLTSDYFHFALNQFDGDFHVFIDGELVATLVTSEPIALIGTEFLVGLPAYASVSTFQGGLKITIDDAVYRDTFTPPSTAFPVPTPAP
jgi:hypothetical protein